MEDKQREFWLLLWGILIAFLIQVIYDAVGVFGQDVKIVIGLGLAFVALLLLAVSAFSKFYKKKDSAIPKAENGRKYKIAYMLFIGIVCSIFLNELALPEILVKIRVPTSLIIQYMGFFLIVLGIVFAILFLVGTKLLKANPSWFLLGASLVSIFYATASLIGIIDFYNANNGTISAIYTVKLFRSIFFASLFGIIGLIIQVIKTETAPHG